MVDLVVNVKTVLFLCTGNYYCSQFAEELFNHEAERDGLHWIAQSGNNLEKAKNIFAEAVKHRPRIRLTIRQRTRVLQRWPDRDERR